MGRAEKRRMDRANRIEDRKTKQLIGRDELLEMRQKECDRTSENTTELLMTCFALAEHRLHGFGKQRLLKSLTYVDELMGQYVEGKVSVEELKQQLKDETGIVIKA